MTVGLFAQSSAYFKVMIILQYMALGVGLINLLPLFCNHIGLDTPGKLSRITLIARSFWYPHHHCLVC